MDLKSPFDTDPTRRQPVQPLTVIAIYIGMGFIALSAVAGVLLPIIGLIYLIVKAFS